MEDLNNKKAEVVISAYVETQANCLVSLKTNKNEKTKIFLSFYETYGVTLQMF